MSSSGNPDLHFYSHKLLEWLGRGEPSHQSDAELLRLVQRCLLFRSGQNVRAAGYELENLLSRYQRSHSEERACYDFCLVLLDTIQLMQVNSPLTRQAEQYLHKTFIRCKARGNLHRLLVQQMRVRQATAFPALRRAISRVLESIPVDPGDVRLLTDPDAFRDLRADIARRILIHRQMKYAQPFTQYLVEVFQTPRSEQPSAENTEAGSLSEQIRNLTEEAPGGKMDELLWRLYEAYVDHYHDPRVSNALRGLVSAAPDRFLEEVHDRYDLGDGHERRAIRQCMKWSLRLGNPVALRILGDIARNDARDELKDACDALYWGLEECLGYAYQPGRLQDVRKEIEELQAWLKETSHPPHRELLDKIEQLPSSEGTLWKAPHLDALVERLVSGEGLDPRTSQQIRFGGPTLLHRLKEIAGDRHHQPPPRRIEALRLMRKVYWLRKDLYFPRWQWNFYQQERDVGLRIEAVRNFRAAAEVGLELLPVVQDGLYATYANEETSPPLREEIDKHWVACFFAARPLHHDAQPPRVEPTPSEFDE